MLDFSEWLYYIEALRHSPVQQAICLLELINLKLDLGKTEDFYSAQKAIESVLRDAEGDSGMSDEEEERKVWLESKHSKSFILMNLRKAFCSRQFASGNSSSMVDPIAVLLDMRKDTGYP